MKKFLSLVLALIMTMSLVTISAGATEYKDLTDKDEIQYEEAVAVLNRIGVITGYDDGSFRPETELTRGAAAKIIVSLLIGPEAASNLPNTYAPYPDVPANHTFAGVISYCKTAGIISGYGDGTFKPANSLTGYAFAKMLLGAIGYDSKIQGYTDTGWTMNVARDGNTAGLFNRIEFDGAAAVNREQACQLALNTLKATMVEYTGGLSITAGDAHVTSNPTISYKTSNQSYAKNISNRKLNTTGNVDVNSHWTVEFGEEHFKDLRLNDEHGTSNVAQNAYANMARDDFGRPSNEWSYKKVTIGTFPIEPDFEYTTQVIHNDDKKVTDASKVRALELNGYELRQDNSPKGQVDTELFLNGDNGTDLINVANIADYTDNGTKVEVYVDEDDADFINTVVVVKTQLMEVKSLKNDAVALKLYDDGSDDDYMGFNSTAINEDVNDVEVNDDCYNALKDMKAGDIVAVIPVWVADNSKYDVAKVYVPETVSGELTSVDTYGTLVDGKEEKCAIAATVGGTNYKVALWNKDLTGIDGTKIRVTKKDVTLHLDEYGNAMLAKDVGATSNFMVIGGYHSGLVDGKVVTFVDGWDIKGNEVSLNIGNINYISNDNKNATIAGVDYPVGNLVHYSSNSSSKYAEWTINYLGVYDVASERKDDADDINLDTKADPYSLKASSSKVLLNDYKTPDTRATAKLNDAYVDKDGNHYDNDGATAEGGSTQNVYVDDAGVKVIYVTVDTDDNEVDSIEVKSGMQAISNKEILGEGSSFSHKRAQACVKLKSDNTKVTDESVVSAVVIKRESGSANLTDLVYVSDYVGSANKVVGSDNNTKPVYGYEVHFLGQDNWDDEVTIYSTTVLKIGDFARARKDANVPEITNVTEDNYYRLTKYSHEMHKALSVMDVGQIQKIISYNKSLAKLMNYLDGNNFQLVGADTNYDKTGVPNILSTFTTDKDLDVGDDTANSYVSLRRAKFIDLTGNKIDSFDDLYEMWNKVTRKGADGKRLANCHRLITVSLVYNDDWDSDDFRDVYTVIVTGVSKDEAGVIIPGSDSEPVNYATPKWTGNAAATDYKVAGSDGKYTVTPLNGKTLDIPAGTGYTATKDANGVWTVTITDSKNETVTIEVNDASIKVEKALTIVLDEESAAAKAGVTIAGNRLVTADEIKAGGTYAGKDAGTVLITLKVPAGVSIKGSGGSDEKLTWTDSGFSYEEAAETVNDGDTIIVVEPTNSPFDADLTYTLTGLGVAVTHKVVVKSDVEGLTFTTSTATVDETTAGDLALNITKGLPAYAKTVDVLYTIEGLKPAVTGTQTAADVACTNGAFDTEEDLISGTAKADPDATNVVITIKDIKVKTQTAKIVGATAADLVVTTGDAFKLPALTVTLPGGAKTVTAKANITGAKTDDATNFPLTDRTLTLTGAASTADTTAHYTSDGTEQVVITVTTTVASMDANKIVATGEASSVAAGADFNVTSGANAAEITLTATKSATPADYYDENATVSLEILSGATATGELKATVAGTTAHTVDITVPAGALTNITGEQIVVKVNVTPAP